MENLLEPKKFKSIDLIVLSKSPWLNPIEQDIDKDGKMSFFSLANIISGDDEEILERIEETYAILDRTTQRSIVHVIVNGQRYAATMTEIIWSRMYVIAYYFYHDHLIWKNFGLFDKMFDMLNHGSVSNAVKECAAVIDRRYTEDKAYQQKLAAQSNIKSDIVEYTPDLMRALQDVNCYKRKIEDIDWEQELAHTLQFLSITYIEVPVAIWLWGVMTLVDSSEKRIAILEKLRSYSFLYRDSELAEEFRSACYSLIHINKRVLEFNRSGMQKVIHFWQDERKYLNDLAHVLSDEFINGEDLVAIANSMKSEYYGHEEYEILARILQAFDENKDFVFDDAADFSLTLFEANHYRRLIVEGFISEEHLEQDGEYVPWLLRNSCFDIYIQKRLKGIEDELNADNKRLKAASELECLKQLLIRESKNVTKSGYSEFEDDTMPIMFINYLKMKIGELEKEASAPAQTLPLINTVEAVAKVAAIVKQAMTGQTEQQPEEASIEQPDEVENNNTADPDSSFFAITESMSYDTCKKELLRCIRAAKNKAAACREILKSSHVYFILSDKTNQEIADAINPWVAQTSKDYVFTEDDFRKARRPKKQ